jgi:hypothetical protein
MQALGKDDMASIEQTIDDEVLLRKNIEFRSTALQTADNDRRLSGHGELTLVGNVRPVEFHLTVGDDGKLNGSAVVKQTDWGITPYSTLFGALKVTDDVEVAVVIDPSLPATVEVEARIPSYEKIAPRELKPALLELDRISRASVEAHYKLYQGYVNKRNEILGKLGEVDASQANQVYS